MSLGFLIGAIVLTVIGNLAVLRYLTRHPLDLPFEE